MTTKVKLGAWLACLLCAGAIAACGSDNGDDSASQSGAAPPTATGPSTTVTATTPQAPTPTPASPGKPSSEPPAGAPLVRVPDLVGQSLAAAQKALAGAGLTGTAEALNGDRTQIRNNWEVCKTVPRGGKRAPGNSPVTLITAAPGGC